MGRVEPKRTSPYAVAFGLGFLFAASLRYNRRYVLLRLNSQEADELIEALDTWIEGYTASASDADDEEVPGLFTSFATAADLRYRLWREVKR